MNTARRFGIRNLIIVTVCALSLAVLVASSLSVASSSSGSGAPPRSPFNAGSIVAPRVAYSGTAAPIRALQSGSAKAGAVASADLDRDGAPDVVAGYSNNGMGIVTVQRGNPDAFAPKDDSVFQRMSVGYNPEALLPTAATFLTPEPIDFLRVGDFNEDTNKDVLVAAHGGGLYLMAGDGRGGLGAPEQITLPGTVTALETGEFNAPDGRTDVAVGVTGPGGSAILIFQDPTDQLHSQPLTFQLKSEATSLQFGALDDDAFADLAVATGGGINLIHGYGRKTKKPLESRIESVDVPYHVGRLALGFFVWERKAHTQIAALADDGSLHVFGRGKLNETPFTDEEIETRAKLRHSQTRQTAVDIESAPSWDAGWDEHWTAVRELMSSSTTGSGDGSQLQLLRAQISYHETEDLLVLGDKENKLNVLSQNTHKGDVQTQSLSGTDDMTAASLDLPDAPAAVVALPQKLNGERTLVVMNKQSAALTMVPLAPTATITVDRTDDPSGAGLTAASVCGAGVSDCSLRGAVQFANANPGTTINLGSNTYTLNINGAGGCTIESSATGNTVGDLEINETTTITGTGVASTIINQIGTGDAMHPGDRAICMDVPLTGGKTFSFSGLTIAGGRDSGINGGGGILGGAKATTLNLTNVTFVNNQTSGASFGGGGATVTGGNMNVTNCTFGAANPPGASRTDLTLANATGTSGGGLAYTSGDPGGTNGALGTLTVTGTTFMHNTAASGCCGGGGLDIFGLNLSAPTVNISTTTFSNNQAINTASGGAMNNEGGNVTIATTSFTSNSALNRGGAIYVGGGLSTLLDGTTNGITFTGNTAVSGGSSVSTASALNVAGTNTVIGGSIEITGGGVWTNNTGSTLNPTDIVIAGGTMTCNNSIMNVSGNLTLGPSGNGLFGGTFNANTSTVNIAGNITTNTGGTMPVPSFNGNTGTINFNGTTAQSISGTLTPTFNNLTDSNTTQPLTASISFPVNGNLNVNGANAIFSPDAAAVISGSGTLTGTGTARASRTTATADFLSQYTITNKTLTNLTIDYSGAGAQTVNNAPAYSNLRISGTGTKTLQGATSATGNLTIAAAVLDVSASNFGLNIGGNWTNSVGASGFVPRNGTVTFNGSSGTQLLVGTTTFYDLTLNNSGATTSFGSTSTSISHNLTTTAGTMDGSTSTITFTGNPGAISGANAKNFNNLVINSGAAISNTTGGNTNIANDYTNNGTFTQAAGLTTTFVTGADGAHSLSGSGATTFGVFTINGSNTVDAGSHNFNVVGATFTASGTFTGNTSTVTFNGGVAQTILGNGAKNFSGLTINNGNGVTVSDTTPVVDALVGGVLTLSTDLSVASGAILQQSGGSAGAGDVIGTVRRTDLTTTAKAFGNPNVTITIDSGTAPNPMDVALVKAAPGDFTTSVTRDYTLTPTGGSGISATVKLHYLTAELNSNPEAKLGLWKRIAGVWVPQGRTGAVDTANKSVTLSGVTSFSDWTLAEIADVSVTVSPTSVLEDSGTAMVYTFNRTGPTTLPLTVNFSVTGTATPPGGATPDYTQTGAATFTTTTGTVTFGIGNATATVNVTPVADTTVESDETAIFTLTPGGYAIVAPSAATGTITNDDADVSLAVAPASVAEDGASNLVYTFTRVGATGGALTVNFSVGGTATFSTDYTQTGAATFTATTGTVTFGAGNSTAAVTVDPTADTTVEPDETVILTVTTGTGYNVGAPSVATGTITNDDADVTVAVAPASVAEDGAANLVYTFTRNGFTTNALTVNFSVGGTATFSADYTQTGAATFTASTGTVSFGAGVTTATVTLDPSGDSLVEPDETAILTVTPGTGYNVSNPSAATGTITNDDTDVTVAVAPASVLEDSGASLVYTFTRTGVTTGPLTIDFSVGGTATFTTDYTQAGAATFTASSGTVTFGAGNTTTTVTITPVADTTFEPDETVILSVISGTGYAAGTPGAATGTITNDDTAVSVAVSPASATEDGATNLVYTFTRQGVTTGALTVNFSVGGTATPPGGPTPDYTQTGAATFTPPIGTVTFGAGVTTATVTIDPTADTTVEPDETVILTVTTGTGYTVGAPAAATGTILNDDTDVSVAVSTTAGPGSSVAEDGATNLVYTFTRVGVTSAPLTVNFSVGGTATPPGGATPDYSQTGAATFTTTTGTVTFAGTNTTATVTIDPTADATGEPDETVILTVTAGTSYNPVAPTSATGTILNDDTAVSVAVSPASVTEDGATNMVYTFTRTGDTSTALTVNFSVGGTATFSTDYTQTGAATFTTTTGTVSIPSGSATATVTIDPTADLTVEPDETVILTVTTGPGYNPGPPTAATGTITNDDTDVSVAVSPASVAEDGAPNLIYTFTRSGVTSGALTVNFSVGGTATFSTDYTQTGAATFTATTGTVTFGAGNSTAAVTIDPTADNTVEPDETAILTVTAGTGYNVGAPSSATGTITNDDATVSVAVSPASVAEDGATNMVYTFTRTGFTGGPLTINFSVGGTATPPGGATPDYTQTGAATFTTTTGTVTFTGTNTTTTVTVDPTADATGEPDETVIFTVTSGTGYTPGAPIAATGTILNDDTAVSVAVSPASVGEDGATNMVYTFTRTGDTSTALLVNFSVGGTATFNTDYTATGADTFTASTGTITIPIGLATAAVTVDPTPDSTVEPDETVILTVTAGSGYNPGAPNPATGTILNDDTDVTLAVSPASVLEDGATNLIYTFTRTGVTTGALTVNFTVGGTATFGTDYTQSGAATFTASSGTVTFAANSSIATVTVDPSADTTVEPDETVILTLAAGTGYNIGAPNTATGTIINDDTDVSVAVSPSSVMEDGAANLIYTFSRTGVTATALTVNFSVGGTAGFGSDYGQSGAATFTVSSGTVTFGAGNATATVTIDPTADLTPEPDETVILSLTAGTGYSVVNPSSATGTIVNDDTSVSVAVSPASVMEDGATNLVYTFTRVGLTTGALTVNFSVGGTATFGGDYSQSGADTFSTSAGTVTFAAGNSTAVVMVDPAADLTVEPDETVILTVVAGAGYNPGAPTSATGTIVNDDTDISVAVSPTSTPEDGAGNLVYTFTRTGVTTGALTVNFSVGGTATFSTDYTQTGAATFTASSGTVTFAANSSVATVTVDPTADMTVEPDETVILTVTAGTGYNIGAPNSATGTIVNDDTDVTLAVSPASVNESGGNLVYTFTRSGVTTNSLTVNFSVGGTATFTSDYTQTGAATFGASSGTVTITTGNTTATVTLTPVNDALVEGTETAILTLTAGGYGIGAPNTATGTITDNDTATVAFAASSSNAPEQTTPHNVGVTLVISANGAGTPMLGRTVMVNVQDLGTGSATGGGTDYTYSSPQTVSFNSGDIAQTKNVSIAIVNDLLSEGNETINLALNTLVDGTGGQVSLVSPTSDTVTIVDNDIDLKVTKVESADPVAAGSGPGNLTYTITLKNNGLTNATGVALSEVLTIPTGVTVDSVTGSAGTSVTPIDATHYTWNVGNLAAGNTATLTAVLTVGASAMTGTNSICDTATVTAANEVRVNTGDDSATECTSVVAQADLEITSKTDAPDPACVEGTITYTIGLRNNGPGPGLNTAMTDAVPANTTFVSAMVTSGTGWSPTSVPAVGGTGNIVFSKASVANGETAVFQVVVKVNAGTLHGTTISNTATASAALIDPTPGNNSKTATTTVDPIPPTITCPANITVSTDPNQCSAVVTYADPTVTDNCPCNSGGKVKKNKATGFSFCIPVCVPASGSTFAKGTTTVTCTASDSAGNQSTCSFTVTVNDTQPPTITCPSNITTKTTHPGDSCVVVTYSAPVVSDNCPGVGVVCTPPSGSCFPLGSTTVTCTATDGSGNTATCTFKVKVFDLCIQDDSDPSTVVLINSVTGEYRFCCHGVTYTGTGTMTIRGSQYTLEHNPGDRRVLVKDDESVHKGTGSISAPPGTFRCSITDRNTQDNNCSCQ